MLRISTVALAVCSASLLAPPASADCDPFPASLIAWWPLDADGTELVRGLDGTVVGGSFIDGVVDGCISVSGGADQGVEVPHDEALDFYLEGGGSAAFMVDFWFRVHTSGMTHLVGKRPGCQGGSGGIDFQFLIDFNRRVVMGGPQGAGVYTDTDVAVVGEWMHVAAGWDGESWYMYINGVDAYYDDNAAPSDAATAALTFGRSGTCSGTLQEIDEVHIWNRVLTPCEVGRVYLGGPLALCECPADYDVSGAVDVSDLLTLLAAWGESGCHLDLDGDDIVAVGDLLILLADWGDCS